MNEALVELDVTEKEYVPSDKNKKLTSWLTSLTDPWRDYRDRNYKSRWEQYYRLWRGIFKESDKTRQSERSKLITPALQQAIEATVAEIEEAIFGTGRWFDISQDVIDAANPDQKVALEKLRKTLEEDMNDANHPAVCSQVFLLGAIYGTGIAKISTEKVTDYRLNEQLQIEEFEKFRVSLTPVEPLEFLIDPVASSINESIGCVHELMVPRNEVLRKMAAGIYNKVDLEDSKEDPLSNDNKPTTPGVSKVQIFEYHGLVPESLLDVDVDPDAGEEFEDLSPEMKQTDDNSIELVNDTLVESIVVVANGEAVLKAVRNPLPRADRAFIAYQHDTVPNMFHGRGVAEKGYNPQKALDAELRARIDAMSFSVHPMMAMDATKLPRGGRMEVSPGKTILTQGDPRSVFMPLNFGAVNQNTFPQAQDLERMVQMGTGSVDTAAQGAGPIGTTLGGMSLLTAATIKRTKRTLANIERNFISPLVHKTAWRYMYFDKKRYPIPDMKFSVQASLGMMAKEMETQQFANLMKTVSADSPAYWLLLQGIYENSSISNKDQMLPVINQMREKALNPAPPPPDPMVEVTMKDIESRERVANNKLKLEIMQYRKDLLVAHADIVKTRATATNLEADSALKLAQAEAAEMGNQLTAYLKEVDALMKAQSTQEDILDAKSTTEAPITAGS